MAGNAPEVSLRLSAQDNASEVLRKLQAQLSSVGSGAGVFNQKVYEEGFAGQKKMAAGFENLARQALGFGQAESRIAIGIGEAFGATVPVLIGIAAAVGLMVKAFQFLHKAEKDADEAYQHFMEGLRKTTPLSIIGGELDVAKERLADLQEKLHTRIQMRTAHADIDAQLNAQIQKVIDLQKQYDDTLTKNHEDAVAEATKRRLAEEKKGQEALTKALEAQHNARAALYNDHLKEFGLMGAAQTANLGAMGGGSAAFAPPWQSSPLVGYAGTAEDILPGMDISKIADANDGLSALSDTMRTVQDILPDIATGFADVFQQLGAGGFDAAAKSFGKFIAQLAGMEGRLLILKGIGKVADAIWLPGAGSASLASGLKMIAAGAALEVFSGAIGGGGAVGNGTGGVSGTTMPNGAVPQSLPPRGTVTIVIEGSTMLDMADPRARDKLTEALGELGITRDLEIWAGGMRYAV